MNVIVNRRALHSAVEGLKRLSFGRMPAIMHIDAHGQTVGFSSQTADEIAVCELNNIHVAEEGQISIAISSIEPVVKRKSDRKVCIKTDGDTATVICQEDEMDVPYTLALIDGNGIPFELPDRGRDVSPQFINVIRSASTMASRNAGRAGLAGVCLDVEKEQHYAVGTDGHRLCAFTCVLPISKRCIVPVTRFLQWSKFTALSHLAEAGGVLRFDAGDWTYAVKTIEEQYPQWRSVIPDTTNSIEVSFTEADCTLIRRMLETFPGYDCSDHPVTLCRHNGQLYMCGQDSRSQKWIVYPFGSPGGADMLFTANRHYLMDAIKAGFTSMAFKGDTEPLMSRTAEGNIFVLMPLRLSDTAGQEIIAAVTSKGSGRVSQTHDKPVTIQKQTTKHKTATKREQKTMTENKTEQNEVPAVERLQESYRIAREKMREANSALADFSGALRDVIREEKQWRSEQAIVRAGLSKLKGLAA